MIVWTTLSAICVMRPDKLSNGVSSVSITTICVNIVESMHLRTHRTLAENDMLAWSAEFAQLSRRWAHLCDLFV